MARRRRGDWADLVREHESERAKHLGILSAEEADGEFVLSMAASVSGGRGGAELRAAASRQQADDRHHVSLRSDAEGCGESRVPTGSVFGVAEHRGERCLI